MSTAAYCDTAHENQALFLKKGWLRTNIIYLGVGILVGICIYCLISAYMVNWQAFRTLLFDVLASCLITLCVANSIYFSQKLLNAEGNGIAILLIYYLSSIVGLVVGRELFALLVAYITGTPYVFLNKRDYAFSLCITVIVCSILYGRGMQQHRIKGILKQKELDVLRLTQLNTQAELAALQARINPHFLYNSLNSIASLIREDAGGAEKMTLQLSKLFRYTIQQNAGNTVTVREEIEIVNTYLDIEKVRFGKRIQFEIDVDPALEKAKIPRFLVQPLVENALKHGLNNTVENGRLTVRIREDNGLSIAVEDNGTPFPENYEAGYGLQSTYDKLSLLYPDQYDLQIRNQPVKEVKIRIPLTYD